MRPLVAAAINPSTALHLLPSPRFLPRLCLRLSHRLARLPPSEFRRVETPNVSIDLVQCMIRSAAPGDYGHARSRAFLYACHRFDHRFEGQLSAYIYPILRAPVLTLHLFLQLSNLDTTRTMVYPHGLATPYVTPHILHKHYAQAFDAEPSNRMYYMLLSPIFSFHFF